MKVNKTHNYLWIDIVTFAPRFIMERIFINHQDTRLQAGVANSCHLRLLVGMDGFSYLVKQQNDVLVLKSWVFSPKDQETSLRRILHSEIPLALQYASIQIIYTTPLVTLLPIRMFTEQVRDDTGWFGLLTEVTPDVVMHQEWKEGGCYVLQGVPTSFYTLLKSARLIHEDRPYHPEILAQSLLSFWQKMAVAQHKVVCINVRNTYLQVAAFDSGHLQFFNSFEFVSSNDVLYYTLTAYKQANLDPVMIPLYISGQVISDSEIYRVLNRFIKSMHFTVIP